MIHGFNKTTLLDYPEHVAATVFTGGCNFRCPFCQNGGLVLRPGEQPLIAEEEVLAHLAKRQGILDGLCITGGEPALQADLENFIRKVKSLGCAVKLDTNGSRPEVLERLLAQGLLDYVAMDVKASRENYENVTGMSCIQNSGFALQKIEESIELLKGSGIPYEFRTTAVKGLHRVEEFEEIGKWLAGSRAYFIQNYRESGEILAGMEAGAERAYRKEAALEDASVGTVMGSFSLEELKEMARLAGKYIHRVELRGVE